MSSEITPDCSFLLHSLHAVLIGKGKNLIDATNVVLSKQILSALNACAFRKHQYKNYNILRKRENSQLNNSLCKTKFIVLLLLLI